MKKAIIFLAFVAVCLQGNTVPAYRWATCRGYSPCHACKNCKYCKYCAKNGGTCGVCSKKGKKARPTFNDRDLSIYQ